MRQPEQPEFGGTIEDTPVGAEIPGAFDVHAPVVWHEIDWKKVKDMGDVIRILDSMDIRFSGEYTHYETIKDLLKEVPDA